jgi:hypothetical protein
VEWPRSCTVIWLVGKENIVIDTAKEEGCEGDNEDELSVERVQQTAVIRPEYQAGSCSSPQISPRLSLHPPEP